MFQVIRQPVASAPSPHWRRDFLRGHGCGERAGVRGERIACGPLTPALSPAMTRVHMAESFAGEREQSLAYDSISEAHGRMATFA